MAKIAVLALGQSAENGSEWNSNNDILRRAVELGLIHGLGDGNLAPEGMSTRAQAVIVIQRMLTLKNGGTLPVNKDAQAAAEKLD